ncbi:MAG: phosphotransferase enzyme family protein [Chloroflexota bacterium]
MRQSVITSDFGSVLRRHFGIAHLRSVQALRSGAFTTASRIVVEPDGASFVVLVYHPPVSRGHIEAMHAVRLQLARAGVPVAAPLAAVGGETIVDAEDGRLELSAWVPHDGFCLDWRALPAAAAVLGRVHDVLSVCCVRPEPPDDEWEPPSTLWQRLRRDDRALREHAARFGREIDGEVTRAAVLLERLMETEDELYCEGHCQLTHGDYTGHNILMRGDEVAAVLDFGRLSTRPRLYDLAYALFWRCFEVELEKVAWERLQACCRAYALATKHRVSIDEWRVLAKLFALLPAAGIAVALKESDPSGEIVAFGQGLDFGEWMLDHEREFARQL